jgi:hypothetical protein
LIKKLIKIFYFDLLQKKTNTIINKKIITLVIHNPIIYGLVSAQDGALHAGHLISGHIGAGHIGAGHFVSEHLFSGHFGHS